MSGHAGRWDFNNEAVIQAGKFGSSDILAWSIATEHGYTIEQASGRESDCAQRSAAATATPPTDSSTPSIRYSRVPTTSPNQRYWVRPTSSTFTRRCEYSLVQRRPGRPAWTFIGGSGLRTASTTGAGVLIYKGSTDLSCRVGTDVSLTTSVRLNRYTSGAISYSHFFAGPFIRENSGTDADFVAAWLTVMF